MSALFQSVASQLGNLGGGYAEARDAQTEAKNKLQETQFGQEQRIREFLEQQKMDALQKQIAEAQQKTRAAGNVIDYGSYQDSKNGKWYRVYKNLETGKLERDELPGDPESVVKTQDQQAEIAARQKEHDERVAQQSTKLETMRETYKKNHPSGAGGGLGAVPLAVARWYKALGGANLDHQIAVLEAKLKSMELTALGDPKQLYQNNMYEDTQNQLKDLYNKATDLQAQAMQRAGAGPSSSSTKPKWVAEPGQGRGSGTKDDPIIVTP